MNAALPAWRSLLYVPVNVEAFVAKAHLRGADAIILDLEDSIAVADKAAARGLVRAAAARVGANGADVLVRINRPLSLAVADIAAAVAPEVAGLLLPKIDSASHVRLLAELVDECEAAAGMKPGHTRLIPMIETAEAFPRMAEIAAAHPRNVALSLGGEDFALATHSEPTPEVLLYPKQALVIAARGAGLLPIGLIGTVADYKDVDGVREVARRSRRFGFAAGTGIHPGVVAALNDGFGPSEDEVASARRIVAAFAAAEQAGRGSVEVDGRMVDIPVVERAKAVIARVEALAAKAKDVI
ncbi:CoA ester lyase [Acuticoccus sp. M5D2P5]|uniref:HpcH/HpaI aldolase/citrate lyase family protein n=1 Tax=Acuticoccus kalidii TaxID=2910977 RepID=UPI001F1B8E1C|nr:CoA ester lyase [Acuticoccus kalidii]MCF3932640.1 CoA ester lyase [Acuticoccus kalidii]